MAQLTTKLQNEIAEIKELLSHAKADNTIETYRRAWQQYCEWLSDNGYTIETTIEGGREALVALYIRYMALERNLKPGSITPYVAGIKYVYERMGLPVDTSHPVISDLMSALERLIGCKKDQKTPIIWENVRQIVDTLDSSKMGLRDKAVILLGFCGAFRRSELCGLDVEDLTFSEEGLMVSLRKSKTDQTRKGRYVEIPRNDELKYCPVQAVNDYMVGCDITTGALFRGFDVINGCMTSRLHPRSVARIVQKVGTPLGLENISGHSLRAGFVTSAVDAGVPDGQIMRQTGHSDAGKLRIYDRFLKSFRKNGLQYIYRDLKRI